MFLFSALCAICPAHLILFVFTIRITFDENTNCRVSYYLVFSNILLLAHFLTQISSSTPYSPNTASVFLKVWESKTYNAQAWGKNSVENYCRHGFHLRSDWMTCFQVLLHTRDTPVHPPRPLLGGVCRTAAAPPTRRATNQQRHMWLWLRPALLAPVSSRIGATWLKVEFLELLLDRSSIPGKVITILGFRMAAKWLVLLFRCRETQVRYPIRIPDILA